MIGLHADAEEARAAAEKQAEVAAAEAERQAAEDAEQEEEDLLERAAQNPLGPPFGGDDLAVEGVPKVSPILISLANTWARVLPPALF